ncbi:MAG: thioredoxin [Acidiferrobacterales bacterium]
MATVDVTKDNFSETIDNNDMVIIDFWAPWCGPCKSFGPIYEEISGKYDDIVFAKVDTEAEQELAGHFQIRSIPTLMIMKQQVVVFSQPGALPGAALEEIIEKAKALDMDKVRAEIAAEETTTKQAE